ncbi:MAG TPA: hypothetical protein VND93_28615, partial [Myxococcales bacterium]|nr:hypothetical protein [Myxococcales bacterium]
MRSLEREAQPSRAPLPALTAAALGVLAALVLADSTSPAVHWVERVYLLAQAAALAACARLVWRGASGASLWTAAALGVDAAVAAS